MMMMMTYYSSRMMRLKILIYRIIKMTGNMNLMTILIKIFIIPLKV